jgi:uncharacterized protein (DUF433 family)
MARPAEIVVDPRVQGGQPVIKGTRVPVAVLTGAVAAGDPVEEVAADYGVSVTQVRAALAYAADLVSSERIIALPTRREPARGRGGRAARRGT